MVKIIYLMAGIIFEAFVLRSYVINEESYTKAELIIGAVIDIIAWPIILLSNIEWRR